MSNYDNTNRGALFTNDRKETDNHPDLSGKIDVEGKEYWLSAWTKRNDDGSFKLLSLSVKPKDSPQRTAQRASGARQQAASAPEFNDDIPW